MFTAEGERLARVACGGFFLVQLWTWHDQFCSYPVAEKPLHSHNELNRRPEAVVHPGHTGNMMSKQQDIDTHVHCSLFLLFLNFILFDYSPPLDNELLGTNLYPFHLCILSITLLGHKKY